MVKPKLTRYPLPAEAPVNQTPVESPARPPHGGELHASGRAVIYMAAFVTGGIVIIAVYLDIVRRRRQA